MCLNDILKKISEYVWGSGLIFLLLSAGFIYTFKTGFVQVKFIPYLIRSIRKNKKCGNSGGISQMKTVCLSLGTAMGTGNITGVASALVIGGPGAVFWMWVSAFFGMALVYGENFLGIKYRRQGECIGPMAYLRYGVGSKVLAAVFAVFCLTAAMGMGGMVQVSSFTDSLYECGNISHVITAIVIFTVIFFVIKGGIGRIGTAAQTLLPIVTVSYMIFSAAVIFSFRDNIPSAFCRIFSEAFNFKSAAGGISGFALSRAISTGIRRGIFSNEAGLGSSPILHCASENDSPELQGMWSVFEVFFDTMVCCTLTALVVLTSCNGNFSVSDAFSTIFGDKSDIFLTASMAVFAFCTIIGWYFCGETAFKYLLGKSKLKLFTFFFAVFSSLGAIITLDTVFAISDIFNGLMAIPNLIGLLLLIGKVSAKRHKD